MVGEGEGIVHSIFEGRMVCELFSCSPGNWPPGHKWSEQLRNVTCVRCIEKLQ